MEKELRMFGLVPYNISPIQQAIQYGHAVVEYGEMVKSNTEQLAQYEDWAKNWKTFIILNGGTTSDRLVEVNDVFVKHGTLNQHLEKLKEMDIPVAEFREPDLGDQLTAVVLIVSEDVFNIPTNREYMHITPSRYRMTKEQGMEGRIKEYGEKNVELKDFLSQFRLA